MVETLDKARLLDDSKRLKLERAQQRSVSDLLKPIINHLSNSRVVALAPIWLTQSTSDCAGYPTSEERLLSLKRSFLPRMLRKSAGRKRFVTWEIRVPYRPSG